MSAIEQKSISSHVTYDQPRDNFSHLSTQNAVWTDFTAGMEVLLRYAGRSEADTAAVARANLHLLHRTLLSDATYRKTLKLLGHEITENGPYIAKTLLAKQDLTAYLLAVQKHAKTQLYSHDQCISMVLVISGKTVVGQPDNSSMNDPRVIKPDTWLKWKTHPATDDLTREGEVFFIYPGNNDSKILNTLDKDCVLLHILLPI